MIRYRRSPLTVNCASSVTVVLSVMDSIIGAYPNNEKSKAYGFRGEYRRKTETLRN